MKIKNYTYSKIRSILIKINILLFEFICVETFTSSFGYEFELKINDKNINRTFYRSFFLIQVSFLEELLHVDLNGKRNTNHIHFKEEM